MDLTPLIDCVFLMILFFLLTTEITVQLEDVELPFALEGKQKKKAAELTAPLIINVKLAENAAEPRAGVIVFDSRELDQAELAKELGGEARYDAQPVPNGRGRGWERTQDGSQVSKLEVVVRADRRVRSAALREVFAACSEAKIYKVQVSSMQPDTVQAAGAP